MKLFAYGSNMLLERIKVRAPDAVRVDIGHISGMDFEYNKIGRRKNGTHSGKANMETCEGGVVWGVIYSMPDDQFETINVLEKGYSPMDVLIQSEANGKIHCKTFVAEDVNTDESLRPYHWYKDLVLAGAAQNGLPVDYIHQIVEITSDPDPGGDKYRDAREARKILDNI